ncbi:TIGR01777 family oxidoreductase [Marinicella sediminis]|uniref:TIGR01777 family oxidoreductase n=1 Tax=Marinicella sediminis TaxID=1792834 RepID=A0ABV7JBA1_9GAMM|nr:TIGR01777 family oxidoreductase [Marinicella sediminis]
MDSTKPVIFITGHTGMVGTRIKEQLSDEFQVVALQRDKSDPTQPRWNYQQALRDCGISKPFAVIHLAGAGIADKRWNEKHKSLLYNSRINGTNWLINTINQQPDKPDLMISASAIGFYGHRPGEKLSEDAGSGDNFVARISRDWEAAADRLDATVRLIKFRFGMILDASGGALKNMLLPFKMGLGGRMGSGQQIYSWIGLTDVIRAMRFVINHPDCEGVYNLTSPHPVSNADFTKVLAGLLNRPAFFHQPALLVKLVFGEVADELLLADARVIPERLTDAGFGFQNPDLKSALTDALA